jgi:single-strand DNA-binding protein
LPHQVLPLAKTIKIIFHNKTTNNMNALRNKVQLIGNLGAKAEIKTLESGKSVANVSIATNEVYKNQQGEKVTETTWHNIVAWGKQAEILDKYTDKGTEIAIEGKLTNRSYTDKEGIKRYVTEVLVNEILILGSKAPKTENENPF